MAYMSVEEWRKQKEAGNKQGTNKSSAAPASSTSAKSSGKTSGYMSIAEWRAEKAKKSAQGWSDAANALLKETTQYHSKWHSKDDEEYTSLYDRTSSLLEQADAWRKQYAGNEEAISAIDSVVKALSDARSYSGRAKDFYSQWDTEDDYVKWGAYQTPEGRKERYASNQAKIKALKEERSQMDNPLIRLALHSVGAISTDEYLGGSQKLKDIDKQIAALESEMRMYERGNTDESGFYYGSKAVDDYGELSSRDDFGKVSSNRNFRNAGREALTEYDAMADSTTWYTDANNNLYDAFGNRIDPSNTDEKGNILHPYANNSKYAVTDRLGLYLSTSEGEKLEALGTAAGMEGTWESIIKDGYDGNWELLEENEVDIYYYLLNNSGQESADKYLDDMKTELNRRSMMQSTELYKEGFSEANALERLALSIATTPAQMISGAAGFIEDAAMTAMGKEINPYSAAHGGMNFSQTVRGEQAEAWDEATGGVKIPFINFTAGDLYQSGMSAFDTFVGGKLGSGAYEVLMGMGAASTEAKKLYEQGASKEQIAWGGALAGGAEIVFEHASIESLINLKDADTVGQFIKNLLIQGGIEASEEGFTDIANTITNAIVMGSESDWAKLVEANGGDRLAAFVDKVLEVGHSAFGGFMSGSMGGATSSAGSYAQAQAQNAEMGQYISGANNTDALMALAQEMAKGASKSDQKNLTKQSERLGKKFLTEGGKNRATGRLYNTVRSVVTTQNISEISTALQEKGIAKKDAKAIAAAVAVQANGMELTEDQQKMLDKFSKNENVQNVVNEILGNKESGINQRAKSVAKFEFDTMRNDIISRMKQAAPGQENETAEGNLATEENTVSYEVSEDGKAHLISDPGKEVSVKGIASIKDGKVMLQLEDGSTVAAEDVSFGSEGEAVIYATVGQMGASVKAANILVNGYKSQSDEMSAEEYAHGIADAFRYGKLGIPASDLAGTAFASKLTAAQREFVYRQGKKAAGKQVSQNQAAVNRAYNEAVATGKESSGEYHAVLEDGISALSLNESQKASYKLADYIAQAANVNIHVYAGKTGERGYYKPSTDEIWLNLNATNQSRKSMMAFALGHELVHRAKKGSPGKYQAFTEFLMKEYSKTGASVESMIAEELKAAKEYGIKMTEEQAFEEVVCDACQRMLLDTDAGKRLAEFGAQNKQNKSFLEDLKRWISEFLDKLRSIFQDVEPDSLAAKEFAKFDKNVKQILADMYVDMTIDAGDKLSTIQNAFGKGTVVETNDQGEFTMARSADGSKVVNNLTTWNNGGRETLEATLLREGYTEDEVNAALTIMDEKQKLVERIANEVNDNGKMAFPEQGRINEATLTTDLKDGHSVLSALVSNGDYPVNIDLLMVCKKRKAYQRVINRLCETGMIKQATVDALAIAEINKILGKHGFETACLGCFVESRRLRIQEWAQTIVKEWNAEVKKRNPNAKPFGFGKGEASLTPDEVMQLIGELETGGEKNDQGNLNLGQGSAVKRMGVLLDKVPTLRRTLSIEDLITPDGLTSLRKFDSNLFSMVKSRYGSNSPKFVQEFNPYNHELAKYGKVPTEYDSLREYLYAIGGARMQSFSDFIIENWFDYCQIVADLAARKLPMHTYTKEIALARLFGLTGIKINMSLIPDVDRSLGKEYAGLTRNAKGELELIWADKDRFKKTGGKSYMQSVNFADAIALQEDPRYSANVGTIAVGISDRHIRMMLADPRIRMIIPYHSSGMNPIFADLMGTSYYKDYTNFQNTTVKQLYNSKGQPVSLKLDKTQVGKLTGGFLFNSVLQELGDARAAAEAYKEWCADASKHTITIKGETYTAELTPKFNDFSGEENYYKLLEDFNTYDCITEEAAPQGDVQQIYPEGFEDILRAELSAQEGHRQKQEANKSFDKAMDEIEGYLKNHTKADTVHYANQHGIKLGAKDKKLSAEDKARLKQLQKEGASFSLPKGEPAPTFYSHMARVVDGVKQEKLGAASVVSMLRGKGVKAEEIKWSGIETFLEGKKSVTKSELQEFIAGSMLQIEEETLTNDEIPYTEDQQKRLGEYEAKRGEIRNRLADEWNRITGEEFPIHNAGVDFESAVINKIIDANLEHKRATFEGRLLEKLRKDLREVIDNNDDFGFDSWRDAIRSINRHRRDFISHYEMSVRDAAVIKKYCDALNAFNELPNMISDADRDNLRSIAREADQWSRKIMSVKNEHYEENAKHMTKWGQYKLKGGKNYREILFRIPGSSYYNEAMDMHWDERNGVLAHARIQDLDTFLGKMLFIEEIQSDWHNEGHKTNYQGVPDAPFRDTYHEYVLKRLIREAAEKDYDSIGWTPAEIQVKRWSEKFAEGYRIEYDQDIPKFLNKYGKKWGTKVGKTVLDNGTEVWSMAITDEMKESVLYEGQVLYSLPKVEAIKPSEEQIESNIQAVAGMHSVHDVDAIKLEKSGKKLMDIFEEQFASWDYNIHSDTFGDIAAKNSSIRSELRHGFTPVKIASIEAIPDVIKSGKIVGWIEKNNGTLFRIVVAAPITIGETPYIMGVMLQRDNQYQRLYLHDVVIEKEVSDFSQDDLISTGSSEGENLFTTSILQKVLNVKQQRINNLPVGEDTSPRALLSNAFETIVTNPIEKQKLQEYKEKVAMLNAEEQKLRELRAEIKKLSFAKGKRDTKRIKELQFDAIQASNQINTLDKMLLRFEASAPLQRILQREKEMVRDRERQRTKEAIAEYRKTENERWNERKEKITERHKASRKKVIETRDKRDATAKLQKLVLDTVKWITYPAKDAVKCPDMLKQPYADFLNGIDLSSKRLAKGGDPTKTDLKLTNAMDSLATALERISMAQDPSQDTTTVLDTGYLDLPAGFVQKIRDMTENVKAMMVEGDYVVNNMTAAEVRQLSQIIRTLNHAIKEVSTLYANMRFANVEALGDDSMSFMDELGEIEKTSGMKDFVEWENALPYYAFKRFGNGGESIFEGLMDAQDKLAFLAQEIFDFQEKSWTGKEAEAWSKDTHTIELPSGGKLTLTTADAMSIYCLSRRAQGLQHLLGGGTRVMGIQKGSTKAKDSRSLLSIQDIDAINSSLTDRQRKVAEAIQEFMSSVCSEWGNEISMKRFLTREFTEKFYFPIESNDENLATKDPAAQQSDLFRLLNISATKPVDPRANNEVIIRNIFDVFTGHAADMARLNAFGLPLLDYMKWLNYREKTVSEEGQVKVRGVRKSMEAAFGNAAKSYILNLVKDVNGRPADYGVPGFYKRMLKNAKTAMVGSSLRVATLQVTSYPRAALVLSPRSLALGLSKKPNIEKAKKYCGIALWKSFGFYDTNIGRSIEEQMKGVKDVRQKMIELSLMGAEVGDALTWGVLWNACEYEVAATKKYKVGTEEFNQAVGKKLREVVYATQVVDSTLTRSQMMRSKNAKAQELSAFMSEPTLSANILMDAGFQFALEKRRTGNGKEAWKKTGKYVGRAFAVYAIGQLTAAFLEGFWDAWRDDDEEKFGEKYIEAFTENLILDLLPFNKIPIISEMVEAGMSLLGIGFFSADNLSSTGVSQTVSAIETWAEVMNGKTSATVYNALYKSMRAISSFYGVSFSGVMREGVDLWNNIIGSIDMNLKIRTYEASKYDYADELLDALIDGNEKRAAKYRVQFEDDKAVNSALKSAIRSRYIDGDISKSEARKYLTSYAGTKIDEAYWDIKEWDHAKETGSDDGYSKYNKLYDAVQTGENLEGIINEYTGNGVKKSDLSEQISTHFKPEYIKMSESERDNFRDNLLDAYEACGIPLEDAEDKVADWDFEAENGYAYDDRKTAYLNGEITDSQLRTALIEYGGYSEENADYQVEAYDWEAQGYGIATVAAVREYYEHCAGSNVPKGTYMHIRQFSNDTDNDVVDGKTVKYSAMKKIMEEIHAQSGLTSEQKTAIAKSLGWSDKNIRKYKLW